MRCARADLLRSGSALLVAVAVASATRHANAAGIRPQHRLLGPDAGPPTFIELLGGTDAIEPPVDAPARVWEDAVLALQATLDVALAPAVGLAPLDPPFASRQAQLPWPVARDVAISARFGLRARTHSNTRDRNSGLAFVAATSTPMFAVAPGVVSFAGVIEGMGGTVIVDHGGGCHTVYARLVRIDVDAMTAVTAGTVVGDAGAAVFEDLPEAYFEIRIEGIPVDPLDWLSATR